MYKTPTKLGLLILYTSKYYVKIKTVIRELGTLNRVIRVHNYCQT